MVCDHDDTQEFGCNENNKYFTQAHYDRYPLAPRHCKECGDKKLLGIDIKVNTANPVHFCKNCDNNDEPCNHALCHICFVTKNNGKSKRKRTTKGPERLCK